MLCDPRDKRVSKLFKDRIHIIREILNTYPENQENAQAKRYAMDKLESLEWIADRVF